MKMLTTRRLIASSIATWLVVGLLSEVTWATLSSLVRTHGFDPGSASLLSLFLALSAGAVVWSVCVRAGSWWKPFGVSAPRRMLVVPLVVLVLLACAGIAVLVHGLDGVNADVDLGFATSPGQRKLMYLLMGAANEELMDRFIVMESASTLTRSPLVGLLVSTVWFTLLHGPRSTFWFIAAGGFLFGAIYRYTGSIWSSILAHFVANVLIISLFSTSEFIHPRLLSQSVGSAFQLIFSIVAVALSVRLLWTPLKSDRFVLAVRQWLQARNGLKSAEAQQVQH